MKLFDRFKTSINMRFRVYCVWSSLQPNSRATVGGQLGYFHFGSFISGSLPTLLLPGSTDQRGPTFLTLHIIPSKSPVPPAGALFWRSRVLQIARKTTWLTFHLSGRSRDLLLAVKVVDRSPGLSKTWGTIYPAGYQHPG